MSHIYSIPLQEGDQYDQTHSSYMPFNFFMTTTPLYQERNDGRLLQKEPDEQMMVSGSSDGLLLFPNNNNNNNNNNNTVKQAMGDLYLHDCNNKWMSSKMRFIKKMMNSESKPLRNMEVVVQDHSDSINTEKKKKNNNNNSPIGFIRVCSDCNTTKTPLWRSGPRGPKSLCNACGIRQRKARRAMAAAAAANGGFVPTERNNKVRKEKRADHHVDRTVPFKKRCKNFPHDHSSDQTNACFDEKVTINLSKNASFHRVFPQDERDAAILLMALSCGPIHS